jgi:hypothetical protein
MGFVFSHKLVGKSMKILMGMLCGILNVVPSNPTTLNVMICIRTLTMSASHKSYHQQQLLAFLLMVGGITLKTVLRRHTNFGFVVMIRSIVWEAPKRNM